MKKSQPIADEGAALPALLESWTRALTAENKRPASIRAYRLAVRRFLAWREDRGLRMGVGTVTPDDCKTFISELLGALKPQSVKDYAQGLRQFLGWCVAEGEIDADPMARVKRPHVERNPPVILADVDLAALLKTCEGKGFIERRDYAIVQLLISTPLRRGGLAGLRVADVDMGRQLLSVELKGGRRDTCPFDPPAALALDRYIRVRARHPLADTPALWLSTRGPLGGPGIYQMIRKRAGQAGLGKIWVHLFRHTFAHNWLAREGSELGLMDIAGWRDRNMVGLYGGGLRKQRAEDEYRRLKPGDRIKT